ncbi:CLUMA_CG019338, isoform A [Clunio marinus]|uniref:CLUMA_CG019338, isoform A n=1 Tax=Clunio marinus TaxID=568069 RepID=A0A1J1J2A8_9DIPT|nr:CLUMA_CG019338, isoform A [Clunio marinus]
MYRKLKQLAFVIFPRSHGLNTSWNEFISKKLSTNNNAAKLVNFETFNAYSVSTAYVCITFFPILNYTLNGKTYKRKIKTLNIGQQHEMIKTMELTFS